ncbi:capsular exopolysaccharide synthesis family protein [Wenyingzhuangia heitensis]|uniref:non-specific protein-tyrosine kinase n=1 Tax=Wenyingzhuangia heitensis TaxID=1487859 RepID=A0ABX0U650_9FLAO|nr:polysaccharide biosynthesis tyrosine autokinase [Wenyingzhuangia heitensis]NIJ44325.1 capsular exopolysaccharide synthesis family protein [Wenyingzhuangia heitensis]
MENNLGNNYAKQGESINIRAEIEKYLIHWKWFLLSVCICVGLAVFYAKSKVNIYKTNTSVLVKEEGGASELQAFQDLASLGGGVKNNVSDEVEVLKSRTLANAYVRKLELNFTMYQQRGLKNVELFNNRPLSLRVLSDKEIFYQLDTIVELTIINDKEFEYKIEGGDEFTRLGFGEKMNIGDYEFLLVPTFQKYSDKNNNFYQVVFENSNYIVDKFQKKVSVVEMDNANIITVEIEYPIKDKAELVLNTMIDLYNQMSIEDKNLVGQKTDDFITKRLQVIKSELDEVDKMEEVYKSEKQITDIGVQSKVFVDAKSENELEVFSKETELRMVEFMLEDIEKSKEDFQLLPTNIGVKDNLSLNASVAKYNDLLLERNRLLRNSSSSNPVVQNLNSELLNSRQNITASLKNIKKQLEITIASLSTVERKFEERISSLPKQAREYRTILRRQSIIANLYSYLLQKKEENEISMAVTLSNAKVIDRAYSTINPVAPKKPIIALVGLILGLIIPFGVIYISDLLDTKFHTKGDLKGVVSVPLLGDIPFDNTEEKVVIKKGSRTSTAEAFRLLRTNLDFMLTPVESKSKIIFVTSTISGEGKTFVSVNTAASLALTGKKVLLMGMDLRAPKITQYLGLPNRNGVTNYIIDKEAVLSEMLIKLPGFDNLDLLSSGVVPPNPAELLLSTKIAEMFTELKKMYDYVIVDTAPVNLVTDTLMLSKHADMFLYVSRANYLDKRMLEVPERLYQEKRLPNMAILINGLDHSRGYGYGYGGYGYPAEESHKNFFQKIFKK